MIASETMDQALEDPNQCQCKHWTYSHAHREIWAYILDLWESLGHHPACKFYVRPPHEILSGAKNKVEKNELSQALAALSKAYHELYWSVHPAEGVEVRGGRRRN
jgi:hypothetical protein